MKLNSMQDSALVIFSGGQDSTTCLYWALKKFSTVEAVTFDYGQRHKIELNSAKEIANLAKVTQTILPINTFSALGGTSLTDSIDVRNDLETNNLPNTFVPGRNLIFLTYASALAYQKGISHIIGGMCQTDYSGYPDCRNNTIKSMELAINLGMESDITIHTPLMYLTKWEIWNLANELGCLNIVKKYSHTCYNGVQGGCGTCNACLLRERGYQEYLNRLGKENNE